MAPDLSSAKASIMGSVNDIKSSVMSGWAGLVGALVGGAGLGKALWSAGGFEQTNIAFGTMIGSVKETQETLERLTNFAAKTPFEMPEIEQAARGLIMFGERGDALMKTLNTLGNAASGTSTPFGMIALIFNQVRGVGKLLTQDFRQLSTRGVLSLQDIAKHYKITTAAAQEMLSKGKVTFDDFKAILEDLSKAGGRFENLMEKQSTSFLGLWSTMKDNFNLFLRAIGESLLPVAKIVVAQLNEALGSVRSFATENKGLAAALGTVVAVMAVYVPMHKTVMFLLPSLISLVKSLSTALLFLWANPIALVFLAIGAALGYAAYKMGLFTIGMKELKNEAQDALKIGDQKRERDQKSLDVLSKLAEKQSLTTEEMALAKTLIAELEAKYGDLGISLNEVAKSLTVAAAAQEQLNKAMSKGRADEIRKAIREQEASLSKIHKEQQEMAPRETSGLAEDLYRAPIEIPKMLLAQRRLKELHELETTARRELHALFGKLEAETGESLFGTQGWEGTGPKVDASMGALTAIDDQLAKVKEEKAERLKEHTKRIHDLEMEQIEDEFDKRIAKINEEYDARMKAAEGSSKAIALIEKARQMELDAVEKDRLEKKKESEKEGAEALEALKEKGRKLTETENETELRHYAAMKGITEAMVQQYRQIQQVVKDIQEKVKLKEEAKSIKEGLRTPEEIYQDELRKIRKMEAIGQEDEPKRQAIEDAAAQDKADAQRARNQAFAEAESKYKSTQMGIEAMRDRGMSAEEAAKADRKAREEMEKDKDAIRREYKRKEQEAEDTKRERNQELEGLTPEEAAKARENALKRMQESKRNGIVSGMTDPLSYGRSIQDMLLKRGSEIIQEKQLAAQMGMDAKLGLAVGHLGVIAAKPGGLL